MVKVIGLIEPTKDFIRRSNELEYGIELAAHSHQYNTFITNVFNVSITDNIVVYSHSSLTDKKLLKSKFPFKDKKGRRYNPKLVQITYTISGSYIKLVVSKMTGVIEKNIDITGYTIDSDNKHFKSFSKTISKNLPISKIDMKKFDIFTEIRFSKRKGLYVYNDYTENPNEVVNIENDVKNHTDDIQPIIGYDVTEKQPHGEKISEYLMIELKTIDELKILKYDTIDENKKIIYKLLEHLYNMGIINEDTNDKKTLNILEPLIGLFRMYDLTYDIICDFFNDINDEKVFNLKFFIEFSGHSKSNMWSYVNEKWIHLCKGLFRQKPMSLGTPGGGAVGDGELFFIFISPSIIKKNKGDICVYNEELNIDLNIEVKAHKSRIYGLLGGKVHNERTLEVCYKYNMTHNISNANAKPNAFELEKNPHYKFFKEQICKFDIKTQKNIFKDFLNCISDNDDITDNDLNIIVNDGLSYNRPYLVDCIAKKMYSITLKKDKFDAMIIFGKTQEECIYIRDDVEDFMYYLNNNIIKIKEQFIRVAQPNVIGMYIS